VKDVDFSTLNLYSFTSICSISLHSVNKVCCCIGFKRMRRLLVEIAK
jgi:hypothetical protein